MAVAVKTLKVGSTVEEKLDFLSEAEMMKRFNHKNIVRLLGVCTRNEPVYTVMEFILYGEINFALCNSGSRKILMLFNCLATRRLEDLLARPSSLGVREESRGFGRDIWPPSDIHRA